jgi:hypothetical protein
VRKAEAQRRHARSRAFERYGLEIGADSHSRIVEAIQQGRSRHVETQSLRVVIHDVDLDGLTVRVVYDRQRKQIATFLPRPNPEPGS